MISIPYDVPDSWDWVRIKSILSKIQYGFNGAGKRNGNYKLLRITDIQNNRVNWNSLPFCDININPANEYQIHKGEIFIARTGGTVGKSFVLNEDMNHVVFAGYLIRFQLIEKALVKYLGLFLNAPLYWNQVASEKAGTGQPNINAISLGNLLMPLPPSKEQKRIIKKIDKLFVFLD